MSAFDEIAEWLPADGRLKWKCAEAAAWLP